MLRKMTWVYAAIALALACCGTAATARAYPRPELSPLIHAADLGGQYATAWLVSNASRSAAVSYPTSNDLNRLVDGFVRVHTGCFPRDMVLVGYSAALGTVFHTNWFSPLTRVYRGIDGSVHVDDFYVFPFWRYMRTRVQPWLVTTAVQRTSNTNEFIRMTHTLYVCWYSLFEYGVFMGDDFGILPNTDMQIDSPVHCNGILSLGMENATPLRLTDFVTCSSNIFCVTEGATVTINNHNAVPKAMLDSFGNRLDSSHPFWKSQSQSVWGGRVRSWVHGVPALSPVPYGWSDPRLMVDPPTSDSSTYYANRCALRILDDAVQKWTPTGYVIIATVPALLTASVDVCWLFTNSFWDNRLNDFVHPLNIDVGKFKAWADTNAYTLFNTDLMRAGTFYVFRTNQHPTRSVVKLMNAVSLPNPIVHEYINGAVLVTPMALGFTFISGVPTYIQGHYNTNAAGPATIMADACTALSADWNDADHAASNSPRGTVGDGANTRILASLVTGLSTNHTSTNTFSYGDVHCLPGYIEDWQGRTMEVRGTIAVLFGSKWQANQTIDPTYSPSRYWWYDPDASYPPLSSYWYEVMPWPASSSYTTNR